MTVAAQTVRVMQGLAALHVVLQLRTLHVAARYTRSGKIRREHGHDQSYLPPQMQPRCLVYGVSVIRGRVVQADLVIAEVAARILLPRIAGQLSSAGSGVAAADREVRTLAAPTLDARGLALRPAMIGSDTSRQISENGRSRTLPRE